MSSERLTPDLKVNLGQSTTAELFNMREHQQERVRRALGGLAAVHGELALRGYGELIQQLEAEGVGDE